LIVKAICASNLAVCD